MIEYVILDYTDSEILLAILNQHTLNPVLATVTNVVLECTNRYEIMQKWLHVDIGCPGVVILTNGMLVLRVYGFTALYCMTIILLIPTHMLQSTAWKN